MDGIAGANSVPRCFTENLRVLELGHNEIDDWDGVEALSALPNLKQLVLRGNPIAGKPLEVSLAEEKAAKEEAVQNGVEPEEETEKEQKRKGKLYKKLDATNKHYHFKIRRLFPMLVVRDGQRIMDKKTHGYVAPPKEEKQKKEKPEKKEKSKKDKKDKKGKPKDEGSNDPADDMMEDSEKREEKHSKRERKRKSGANIDDPDATKPTKKSKLNSGEPSVADAKVPKKKAVGQDDRKADKSATPVVDKPKEKEKKDKRKDKQKDKKKDKKKPSKVRRASSTIPCMELTNVVPLCAGRCKRRCGHEAAQVGQEGGEGACGLLRDQLCAQRRSWRLLGLGLKDQARLSAGSRLQDAQEQCERLQ